MITATIVTRRLREGKTYVDFRKAWYYTVGFGTATRIFSHINAMDPRKIIVICFVEMNTEILRGAPRDRCPRAADPCAG